MWWVGGPGLGLGYNLGQGGVACAAVVPFVVFGAFGVLLVLLLLVVVVVVLLRVVLSFVFRF